MSPELREALAENKESTQLDPYKSDLYSAGLIILELLLRFNQGTSIGQKEINSVIENKEKAAKVAAEHYINDNLIQRNNFIGFVEEQNKIVYYKTVNILKLILHPDE